MLWPSRGRWLIAGFAQRLGQRQTHPDTVKARFRARRFRIENAFIATEYSRLSKRLATYPALGGTITDSQANTAGLSDRTRRLLMGGVPVGPIYLVAGVAQGLLREGFDFGRHALRLRDYVSALRFLSFFATAACGFSVTPSVHDGASLAGNESARV